MSDAAVQTQTTAEGASAGRAGGVLTRLVPAAGRASPRRLVLAGLTAAYVFLAFWWPAYLQSLTYGPVGFDSFFHIKYTRMFRQQGPLKKLPWTYYTIRRDHFRDHHLLYHVLLIPFTFGDLRQGAKAAASVLASLALLGFLFAATRRDRAIGLLLSFLVLGVGSHVLYRLCLTRVDTVSLLALMLGAHFALERRYRALAVTAFLYVLLYDGAVLLLIFCVLQVIATLARERRFDWRLLAFTGAGFVLGYVLNPYFPENLNWLAFNVSRVASGLQQDYPTGTEWRPVTTWEFVRFAPAAWVVLGGTLLLLLQKGKPRTETFTLLLMTLFLIFAGTKSRRYVLYWGPFSLLFAAHALPEWIAWAREGIRKARLRVVPALAVFGLIVLAVPGAVFGAYQAAQMVEATSPFDEYQGCAAWLERHSEPGDIVFNTEWDSFPKLFFFNDKDYYVIGLDLLYLVKYDQTLYNLYNSVCRGQAETPSSILRDRFKARFMIGNTTNLPLVKRCDTDRGLKLRYLDAYTFVYEVKPAEKKVPAKNDDDLPF